ncbi:MAG: hypothetical protein U9R44_01355 [Candidatus Omnitrophota bacterium]|nr:hypothetical protein [Candidatus Omnitrophota bacterium]
MKLSIIKIIIALFVSGVICINAYSQQKIVYNCEQYIRNWKIPEWSIMKDDHISPILALDKNFTEQGDLSIKLTVSFSGESWSAGIVETEGLFDLTLYKAFSCEIYLSKPAPKGIEARIIIVTDKFKWIEMSDPVALSPGRRTTVSANLKHGNHSWRSEEGCVRITDHLKATIRKIAIRIESNIVKHEGPVYIDKITFVK